MVFQFANHIVMKNIKAIRIHTVLAVIMVLFVACQPPELHGDEVFDDERAFHDVEAQVGFGPRFPASEGHEKTREWIVRSMKDRGWHPQIECFDKQGTELCNIIAWPRDEQASSSYILLGAHYDTRRLADSDPAQPFEPVPGANDGASGVAILIELARVLDPKRLNTDIALVFFDGEDQGHLDGWDWSEGARFMAAHMEIPPAAVIIVDMVGDQDLQLYIEKNSDPELADEIWSIARKQGFSGFIAETRHAIIDDHLPFAQRGVPAVDIIDIEYPAWHTTRDTIDQISADSLYQVGRTLQLWVEAQAP
jgi:glutaminyl-peptide cyclotransferase